MNVPRLILQFSNHQSLQFDYFKFLMFYHYRFIGLYKKHFFFLHLINNFINETANSCLRKLSRHENKLHGAVFILWGSREFHSHSANCAIHLQFFNHIFQYCILSWSYQGTNDKVSIQPLCSLNMLGLKIILESLSALFHATVQSSSSLCILVISLFPNTPHCNA